MIYFESIKDYNKKIKFNGEIKPLKNIIFFC